MLHPGQKLQDSTQSTTHCFTITFPAMSSQRNTAWLTLATVHILSHFDYLQPVTTSCHTHYCNQHCLETQGNKPRGGRGTGTGIAHQPRAHTKPRNSHTINLIYQPWVLQQWCQQSAYVKLWGVNTGALGTLKLYKTVQSCPWNSV